MTWFKVDDSFESHPKAEAASLAAVGLWTVAGSWCGRHLQDGNVPDHVVRRLSRGAVELADELVSVGLWRRTRSGYRFHQWSERNPTRDETTALRDKKSMGGLLGSHRRWHGSPDGYDPTCSLCQDGETAPEQAIRGTKPGGSSYRSTHGHTQADANAPDPTRPVPKNKPSSPPSAGETDPAFNTFWAVYPRRVSKTAARKAWNAALKRGHDPGAITAAAKAYAEQRLGQDHTYTAHAATWLNGERYLDEQASPNGVKGWWDN